MSRQRIRGERRGQPRERVWSMGKNGKQMSYDQFTTAFAYILAQLPEDQRINIETYFTSGPAVGG